MTLIPTTPFGWGLIGPGRIAQRFAEALAQVPGANLSHVCGRDQARAAAFANRFGAAQASTDMAALLSDPNVQAVYIATPHAQHGEAIRACLLAGKPVLCEKPLVAHGALGRELVALARERKVFLMEALWTRFLPLYEQLGALLRDGVIGELRGVQSSFCFHAPYDPKARLFAPELAGGALLDLGVYNLSMTRWALQQSMGTCPEPLRMEVAAKLAPTGVDQRVSGLLEFDDGVTAQFICASDCVSANAMQIIGSAGSITMPRGFSYAQSALLLRPGEPDQAIEAPWRVNGFEGQIESVMACVRAGRIECEVMPLDETLATLDWMDRIRGQIGVRYPFE